MEQIILDKKDMAYVRKKIEVYDSKRSKVINSSRDIIKQSKLVIYALHRNNLKEAKKYFIAMQKDIISVRKSIADPRLIYGGSFKAAEQEYVEAAAFYYYVIENRLIRFSEMDVHEDHYLLGLFDLYGELVRKAVNSAINEEYDEVFRIRDFMGDLYSEFLKFDFANGELRKKFDGLKYSLQKVDDLVFQIKIKLD